MRSRSAPLWVFDLDNTLHDASPHIFPHINRAMTAYLVEHLALDEPAANQLRMDYWQRYGATLLGLMRNHGTEPQHFLWHTHQFPALPSMVVAEKGLRRILQRLPGRMVVFSNAPAHYSAAVLDVLGIRDLFVDVFTIERVQYRPKPDLHGFRRVLQRLRCRPEQAIMVEDTLPNLAAAKRLGMKTLWVGRGPASPAYVDARIAAISELPGVLPRLIKNRRE